MPQSKSYVNPTSLSLPSPPSPPSPTPSSEPEPGPSRKRARTEMSAEERKEARAHRNRIAAQNSRDRRKAQFGYLERRVAELEEENRQLRAGMGLTPIVTLSASSRQTEEMEKERERQRARERENEELKERIRTLEEGWGAVMKALAAQGFPAAMTQPPSSAPAPTQSQPTSTSRSTSPESTSTRSTSVNENSSTIPHTSFPLSPAPSHTSLEFDLESVPSASPIFPIAHDFPLSEQSSPHVGSAFEHDSTRHLARMATIEVPSMALQRVVSPRSHSGDTETAVDDATMEVLFREILAPSPCVEPQSLPPVDNLVSTTSAVSAADSEEVKNLGVDGVATFDVGSTGAMDISITGMEQLEALGSNWVNDLDVHKVLGSILPAMTSSVDDTTLSELNLSWDLETFTHATGLVGISAF